MTLEKCTESRLISVVLSSPRARAAGMKQSDNEGASNPGLPRMRWSGWDSLMVHDSKLRVLHKWKGGLAVLMC